MTAAQFLVVFVALVAANVPFVSRRGAFFLFRKGNAPLFMRLIELVALYFCVGLLAGVLEGDAYAGRYPQNWEFYAITFCLFLVLAYPGFVFRYLWPRKEGDGR